MNELSDKIIGAAIEVHRELGRGLLESTYEACLTHELNLQGIKAVRQKKLPIHYKGLEIDEAYRIDVIIEDQIILELKVVDQLNEIHLAQLLTYLKLSGCSLGYLINFNVPLLKDGIRRVVNNHAD
ncbi:MAG: GxxExxY protein [Puniceicoccaceae bacterium MED-G30]|jgi:GxxExxY protein|nr:MAG: GxxExxY protein [Puniceicoccaceae bacterium MED-G30]|tara:strand:- start:1543 stop:1920 length:378 start_codon:yes stop_codon:yes gene_type:complete